MDDIVHEIDNLYFKHRLVVNGLEGDWTRVCDIAEFNQYRAVADVKHVSEECVYRVVNVRKYRIKK